MRQSIKKTGIMKTLYILIATCAVCLGTLSGCKQKEGKSTRPITPLNMKGKSIILLLLPI